MYVYVDGSDIFHYTQNNSRLFAYWFKKYDSTQEFGQFLSSLSSDDIPYFELEWVDDKVEVTPHTTEFNFTQLRHTGKATPMSPARKISVDMWSGEIHNCETKNYANHVYHRLVHPKNDISIQDLIDRVASIENTILIFDLTYDVAAQEFKTTPYDFVLDVSQYEQLLWSIFKAKLTDYSDRTRKITCSVATKNFVNAFANELTTCDSENFVYATSKYISKPAMRELFGKDFLTTGYAHMFENRDQVTELEFHFPGSFSGKRHADESFIKDTIERCVAFEKAIQSAKDKHRKISGGAKRKRNG